MKKAHFTKFWFRLIAFILLGFFFKFLFDSIFSIIYRNYELIQSFYSYLLSIVTTTVIIEGLYQYNNYLNKKIGWDKSLRKRFVNQLFVNVLFAFSILLIVRFLFGYLFFDKVFFRLLDEVIFFVITFLIVVVITFIDFGFFLFEKWKVSLVEMEKYNKDRAEFQFEMLQAQVNPHFLFNSLNTLSSLIYENQDQAAAFTRELADVYRYVLESRKKETVQVKEELNFLNSFIYLYKLRFDQKISFEILVEEEIQQRFIPPLTLQLLIENAVKHNIVSLKKPLHVKLYSNNNYIHVINNLQLKLTESYSSEIGLTNIKNRFRYLTDKEVIVEKTAENFKVSIPILEKNEGTNN